MWWVGCHPWRIIHSRFLHFFVGMAVVVDFASDEGFEPGFECVGGGGDEDAEGGCEGEDEDALELVEDECGHCGLGWGFRVD